jgi:hypothetical protein
MAKPKLEPTVTIGGAPAGYKPTKTTKSTVTIGGAPAGYTETVTPNYITGEGVPGVKTTPKSVPATGGSIAEDIRLNEIKTKPKTSDKTLTGKKVNTDGSVTLTYSDGTEEVVGGPGPKEKNKSAFDLITLELKNLGLESLIPPLTDIFVSGIDDADSIRLALAQTDAYKTRFKANEERIKAGLRSLSPAEYIRLEDQYQEVMRNYGLPASYYTKDATGKQVGFDKFIAGDVSAIELEDRISTAQKRVINANPQVSEALKQFYPDITNGDILAYTLDPTKGLEDIKRKVTAAEIGGAALQSGLKTGMTRAEELGKYGVDKAMATEGYSTIGAGLQRGSELAGIYKQDPYTQTTAEEEIFKLSGAQEARKKRQKITGLEKATFGGQTGLTSGALARDRAGGI